MNLDNLELVNMTPHEINVYDENDELVLTIPPSGSSLRISQKMEPIGKVNGVTVYNASYGALQLVDNVTGTQGETRTSMGDALYCQHPNDPARRYIVSGQVLEAIRPFRSDLLAPGELVRDKDGKPVGCRGFRN